MTVPLTPPATTRCGLVALAGAPNVGKSSLLNALVGQHLAIVSPKAQATRIPVVGLRTEGDTQFVFQDLPGLLDPAYALQERMQEAAVEALQRADLVLHLHPAPEAPAPDLATLARLDAPLRAPVVPVLTKADLVPAARRTELAREALVISLREGPADAMVRPLLDALGPRLPVGPFRHDPDDVGTQPLRFFVTEYLREAAFDLLGDELPYAFAATVEEFREDERPMYIRVALYVERESQKGIVIGKGGQTIKALGAHARRRVEELVGQAVYLDSWVKVLPRWRKRPASLARLGFPNPRTDERRR